MIRPATPLTTLASTSLLSLSALAACGGDAKAPTSPTTTSGADAVDGVMRPVSSGQLGVAHFATLDGTLGLVLDRSGGAYKLRMDGSKDVVELTPLEDRHFGERKGFFLRSPDGKNALYLGVGGDLSIFTATDQLPLNSDKPADRLPAATIAGAPKLVTTPADAYRAKLLALSVTTRLPGLGVADASNLDKVRDAFAKADKTMAVHYAGQAKEAWVPEIEWTPGNQGVGFAGGSTHSDLPFDAAASSGLGKYGGVVKGYSEYESLGNHLFVQKLKGYPPALPPGTPGLVWNVDGTRAYFVTFDGARYGVDTSEETVRAGEPLVGGAGNAASWPPPLTETLLGVHEITGLAKIGAMPQANADRVLADDDAWNDCAQKAWKKAKPEIDRLATADIHSETRMGRADKLVETWTEKVRAMCKAPRDKMSADLTQTIEARNQARLKLYTDAKAKFGS